MSTLSQSKVSARTFLTSAALLAALVVAALNAARGRWDVWSDPARPTFADRGDG